MNDYAMVETSTGTYAISPGMVHRIAYQAAYYKAKNRGKKKVRSQDGWGLPETYHYEFNYAAAKMEAKTAATTTAQRVVTFLAKSARNRAEGVSTGLGGEIEAFRAELVRLERETQTAQASVKQAMRKASHDSMRNIHETVRDWEIATDVARITRDLSADVFIVAAGTLTGGAALAGLGAGSLAKGAFKYQDTENVGAAVLEGTTTFVVGAIPVPGVGKVGKAQHYAIVYSKTKLEAGGKFATALVEGKQPLEAATSVGVSMLAGAGAGRLTKNLSAGDLGAVKGLMGDTAIPVRVRLRLNVSGAEVLKAVGAEGTKALAGKGAATVSDEVARRLRRLGAGHAAPKLPVGEPVLADLAVLGPDASHPPRRWL